MLNLLVKDAEWIYDKNQDWPSPEQIGTAVSAQDANSFHGPKTTTVAEIINYCCLPSPQGDTLQYSQVTDGSFV